MTSKEFFSETFKKYKASQINIHKIPLESRELSHFYNSHPVRKDFYAYDEFDIASKYDGTSFIATSTTFGIATTTGIKYRSFIGLDVEHHASESTKELLIKTLKELETKAWLFRTPNSYHLYIRTVFTDELAYIKQLAKIVETSAHILMQPKLIGYCQRLGNAINQQQLEKVAIDILENVGHAGEHGAYALFDLRHIARGIYSNSRNRFLANSHIKDGIRSQLFFGISQRGPNKPIPELEVIYDPNL